MGRPITDLTGRRFGRLTVLSQSPNRYVPGGNVQWYCKCDCGATIEVRGDNLLRGHTNSCGCLRQDGMRSVRINRNMPKLDLRGEKFGRLTAIAPTYRRDATKSVIWKCKCDCGKTIYVGASNLRSGNTNSCGCLRREGMAKRSNKRAANFIDMKGSRFGKLLVVAPTYRREPSNGTVIWKCKCDCGKTTYVNGNALRFGNAMSCGCLKKEKKPLIGRNGFDITGKRFGRLTAIKPTRERDIHGSIIWKCKCDCGKIKFVGASQLCAGNVKSCGCLRVEHCTKMGKARRKSIA